MVDEESCEWKSYRIGVERNRCSKPAKFYHQPEFDAWLCDDHAAVLMPMLADVLKMENPRGGGSNRA